MILFLREDLANLFRHGILSERLALRNSIAVIANRFILIVEIVPKHVLWILRRAHRLGGDHWHLTEIIDLPGED